MAPLDNDWRQPNTPQEVIVVESWSEGVMLGSLMIMAGITLANMRRRIWLHKLIFLEVSSIDSGRIRGLLTAVD